MHDTELNLLHSSAVTIILITHLARWLSDMIICHALGYGRDGI